MSTIKSAFTLAEVLITLGIIGVVAALTLPTLIHKINGKILESQFKKSYSNLQNAFRLVIDDGYEVYELNPTESRPDGDPNNNSDFGYQLALKYKWAGTFTDTEKNKYKKEAKNFTKTSILGQPQCSQFFTPKTSYELSDGSAIAIMQNCGKLWITLDINGIKNGPNAMGHDIFIFSADKNTTELAGATTESEIKTDENGKWSYNNTEENKNKCSNTSKSNINGATCAPYAIKNECPWDSSKTYWECLP